VNRLFWINFGIFLLMQAAAQVALKLGSESGGSMGSRRWWFGFVAANAVGAPSILFVKELYKAMPEAPNIVVVMVMAGVFVLTQLVFMIFFRSRLDRVQWGGVALLALGAVLASLGGG
jgi:uncharacterized membrane protein